MKNKNQLFEQIAKEHLQVETLETRNSDSLDFYDVSVWGIAAALEAAYQAGLNVMETAALEAIKQMAVYENKIKQLEDQILGKRSAE